MTNPADPPERSFKLSARQSRKQPLTERDGVTLREEVRSYSLNQDCKTWNGAIREWRHYIRSKRGVDHVYENTETGEEAVSGSSPHRFAKDYADTQYAKLKDLERGVKERFGRRLHTAMLTLTGSSRPDGEPLPPVDHLDQLLESWDSVSRELRRVLSDYRSARLAILEPHPGNGPNNGYFHIHIAVFVDGKIAAEEFEPVLRRHVDHSPIAEPAQHTTDEIQVRHVGKERDWKNNHALAEGLRFDSESIDNLAGYLAEYLGTSWDDPLDAPEFEQAANAVLWSTERQRWRPCQTAQQIMSLDQPEPSDEWELVAVEIDGDRREVDPDQGGVDRFETGYDPPDVPDD
jgi:hypothetical protein